MSFIDPPTAEDIGDTDYGPYPVAEIIAARSSILETVQEESSAVWSRLRSKLGIMPDGKRLNVGDQANVWVPNPLPENWSAPVTLRDPRQEPGVPGVENVNQRTEGVGGGVGGEKMSWGAPAALDSQRGNAAASSSSSASSSTSETLAVTVASEVQVVAASASVTVSQQPFALLRQTPLAVCPGVTAAV